MEIDEEKLYKMAITELPSQEVKKIFLEVANAFKKLSKGDSFINLEGLAEVFLYMTKYIERKERIPVGKLVVNYEGTLIPLGYHLTAKEEHRKRDLERHGIVDSGHYVQADLGKEGSMWITQGHYVIEKDNTSHKSSLVAPLKKPGQWNVGLAFSDEEDERFLHMGSTALLVGDREGTELKNHFLSTKRLMGGAQALYLVYNHEEHGPILIPLDDRYRLTPYVNLSKEELKRFHPVERKKPDLTFI